MTSDLSERTEDLATALHVAIWDLSQTDAWPILGDDFPAAEKLAGMVLTRLPAGEGVTPPETVAETVYVVRGPRGFTEKFDARTVETLVRMGLIQHVRDGYAVEDGSGNGCGPLHRYYSKATD